MGVINRQAVLLSGGASRRMGQNKAEIVVDGEPNGKRIARLLHESGWDVVVLGRDPIEGFAFQRDREQFGGPLAALRDFVPSAEVVFVASCDLVRFQPSVATALGDLLGDFDACLPMVNGRLQPLCATYRKDAFEVLRQNSGLVRVFDWLDHLNNREVSEEELRVYGISPEWVMGTNTPEELNALNPGGK